MPPSYRERLRIEGWTLAACGAVGSVLLVAFVPESRRGPWSTILQLAAVAALLEIVGSRLVRRWLDGAHPLEAGREGSGEPTPLWLLPMVMCGLAAVFVLLPETNLPGSERAGWDAGLRITGGCLLVGLWQGLRYERLVANDEEQRGRRYLRTAGSRLIGGTKLGWLSARR